MTSTPLPLNISMKQNGPVGILGGKIHYELLIATSSISWSLSKHFNDFVALKEELEQSHLLDENVPFPPKLLWYSAAKLKQRQADLMSWLVKISNVHAITMNPSFRRFFEIDEREETLAREAALLGSMEQSEQILNESIQHHEALQPSLQIKDTSSHLPSMSREADLIRRELEESKQLLEKGMKEQEFSESKLQSEAIKANEEVIELKQQYEQYLHSKYELEKRLETWKNEKLDPKAISALCEAVKASHATSDAILRQSQELFDKATSELKELEKLISNKALDETRRCLAETTAASSRLRLALLALVKEKATLVNKEAELNTLITAEMEARNRLAIAQEESAVATRRRQSMQDIVIGLQELVSIDQQQVSINTFERDSFSHQVNRSMELNEKVNLALKETEGLSTKPMSPASLGHQIEKTMQQAEIFEAK